jgi:hypothetical protein
MRMLRDWAEPTFLGRAVGFLGLLRLAQGETEAAQALLVEGQAHVEQVDCLPSGDLSRCVDELRAALDA